MQQWKLTDLALQEIASLQDDGVILQPIDIIRIHRLSQEVETPETQRQLARGIPVPLGKFFLYPITLAASAFLEASEPYCKEQNQPYLLAYAMAHGSDETAMQATGKQAVKNAIKWAKRLPVPVREMTLAIETVMGEEIPIDDPRAKKNGMSAGELSSTLCALVGGSPEIWERQCSISYCCEVLRCIMMQNQVENKPSINDPRIIAERRLGLYIEGLRKRHKKNQQECV